MNEQEDFRPAQAALKNDAEEIRRLRAAGVEVNPIYEAGPSPMETALQLGHFEAFWALLEEAAPEVLEDALCLTAYWGQVSAFERLLAQGVPVDAQDSVGENALASAAKGEGDPQSRLVIARRLMAAGIDPADALTYAAQSRERAMLDLLRSKGQKLDLAGAVSLGDLDEIRRALTKETPTSGNLQAAAAQGNVETLRLLIARTPLRPPHIVNFAISQNHLSAVEFMLANGWNVREPMYLLLAAQHGHAAMLKLLLSLGADPNLDETEDSEPSPFADPENRRSPLWTAVNGDHLEALDVLLRAGADPNGVAFCGSPLRTAIDRGRSAAVIARLREAGAQDIPPPARR